MAKELEVRCTECKVAAGTGCHAMRPGAFVAIMGFHAARTRRASSHKQRCCLHCGAKVGRTCVTPQGKPAKTHQARKVMA